MKQLSKYITAFVFTALLLAGCKKFLEESSPDEIRPTTTQDLYSLMIGTAYPYQTSMDTYLDLLTDDMKCNGMPTLPGGQSNAPYAVHLNNGALIYTWNPAMFDMTPTGLLSDQDSWQIYYKLINGCNLVKEYVNKVSGPDKDKNAMLGQVLFLRAFYYLKLVNIYARPYNGDGVDPASTPGVPLILSALVSDERRTRNTIAEVYAQIEQDLLEAADLLKNNYAPGNSFRVTHLAAYALLSRMYLYMGRDEDMGKVIQYATDVINEKPALTLLKSYFTSPTAFNAAGIYDVNASQEVIWVYGVNPNGINLYLPASTSVLNFHPPYAVSNELSNLYDKGKDSSNQGDLRYVAYLRKYSHTSVQYPWRSGKISINHVYGDRGIRVAEMYLNRVEALIRKYKITSQANDLTQALNDINTLRLSRYDTRNASYTAVTITNADNLFAFLKDERRRELCLEEGHRWFDIRRWAVPVTHTFIDANGTSSTHTLAQGSPKYALPIPFTALENNYNLAQNPQ